MVMVHTDLNDLPQSCKNMAQNPTMHFARNVQWTGAMFSIWQSGNKIAAPIPRCYLKQYQVEVGLFFHTQSQRKQNLWVKGAIDSLPKLMGRETKKACR